MSRPTHLPISGCQLKLDAPLLELQRLRGLVYEASILMHGEAFSGGETTGAWSLARKRHTKCVNRSAPMYCFEEEGIGHRCDYVQTTTNIYSKLKKKNSAVRRGRIELDHIAGD
jgi:hypothetical protein